EKNDFFQLHELDELRLQAYENSKLYKARTKAYHDKKLRIRKEFKAGDKVLLYNSNYKFKGPKLRSNDKVMLIKLKWIFKVKTDKFGRVLKKKARLVAQGFRPNINWQSDIFTKPVPQERFEFLIEKLGNVGGVKKISSTGSKFMANGEDYLDGCDGEGGEVNLGVVNSLLGKIPEDVIGERGGDTIGVDGGAVW
nr:reverse transcriptase domain-containing protein [Tanacetum cinerariifolium]